ncbi:hypothetical protein CUJ87_30935 (plasmid) [Paraburkholderia caledonica]|nr:hypothetical protein CUJ87_30935 [Paraburkholderia caledonica]
MPIRPLKAMVAIGMLVLTAWFFCRPVIVLHYSADARRPVAYFLNDNDEITRGQLLPGQTLRFHTPMFPGRDRWIEISVPFASRDGVDIRPPYSRVDVYIDATGRIGRTEAKYQFFDRF